MVASDLDSLAAGVALKHDMGARLIYDAHEFWPYSFPQFKGTDEERAWVRIERMLARHADVRFAVSPGLAAIMTETYGAPFAALPNAVPLADAPSAPVRQPRTGNSLEFLFLGGFAPDRESAPDRSLVPHA